VLIIAKQLMTIPEKLHYNEKSKHGLNIQSSKFYIYGFDLKFTENLDPGLLMIVFFLKGAR